jgi:hypothetical protein
LRERVGEDGCVYDRACQHCELNLLSVFEACRLRCECETWADIYPPAAEELMVCGGCASAFLATIVPPTQIIYQVSNPLDPYSPGHEYHMHRPP